MHVNIIIVYYFIEYLNKPNLLICFFTFITCSNIFQKLAEHVQFLI